MQSAKYTYNTVVHDAVSSVVLPSPGTTSTSVPTMVTPSPFGSSRGPPNAMGKRRDLSLLARAGAFLVVDLLCFSWSIWLVVLTMYPNQTINSAMGTADLDSATFWHFAYPPAAVGRVGVAGLLVVAVWYLYVMWLVAHTLCGSDKPVMRRRSSIAKIGIATSVVVPSPQVSGPRSVLAVLARRTDSVTAGLLAIGDDSDIRKRMNEILKVVDVVLHWIYLWQLLEDGAPTPLIVVFATIVTLHALIFSVVFALPFDGVGRLHIILDTVFDLLVAVGFPLLVVLHSLSVFAFDFRLMAINERVFPTGFFERYAGNVADPWQVVAARDSLAMLQINSTLKLFTRVGTMFALVRRSTQLAWVLAEEHAGLRRQINVYTKAHRRLSVLFGLVAVAFVVLTSESVRTSALACKPHKECTQHAHRWLVRWRSEDISRCPCIAIIDRDVLVATHDQWLNPPDRADKIAQLAAAGTLQTLHLVNRALSVFPTQLRACKGLRHVSLLYTNTERLPEWFVEFTNLEYLLIEGKYPSSSLRELPDYVFDTMPKLAFIHLGMHGLKKLPSFHGLKGLKSLTLAGTPHLAELPAMDTLQALEKLSVVGIALVETFPDLSNLRKLTGLTLMDRGAFCCNGFLGQDKCDLSRSMCGYHPLWHTPPVTQCLDQEHMASVATRAIFDKFYTTACAGEILPRGSIKLDSSIDDIVQCNGTLYRRCRVEGFDDLRGMCYNTRGMVIACSADQYTIEMRRQQIQLGLGQPCNKAEEAWLGCGNSSIR